MRRKAASDHYKAASIPNNAKLRAFRCQDFSTMSRQDRLDYANAVHAAVRADNLRQGQSYKPRWKSTWECQSAYDQHMQEQRVRIATLAEVDQWAKDRAAARKSAPIVIEDQTPIVIEPAPIAEPIVIKPSILPALLAEHFHVGARKLAAHLIANAQRELADREADIAVAVTNFCIELGI